MRLPLATLAAVSAALLTAAPALAWQVTWLGHSGFVVEAKDGTRVMIDPWLKNPKFPQGYKLPGRIDAILISHGHFDHAASATELSKRYHAPIVGCFELTNALQPKGGPAGLGGNVGGTITVKGLRISLINAVHSSSTEGDTGQAQYTGKAVGFVLQAAGERTLMHAGDTGLTRDFDVVRMLYHPAIAMLPIGGWFTMDPAQAAIAASWIGAKDVVPMHYGTFPLLKGTPAQLRAAAHGTFTTHVLVPGKTVRL